MQRGAVAQLGARLHGMQEVVGSTPIGSTRKARLKALLFLLFVEQKTIMYNSLLTCVKFKNLLNLCVNVTRYFKKKLNLTLEVLVRTYELSG